MKFLTLTSLATGAFAGVLVQRDIATIQAAMNAAGTGIVTLDNAVKAFTGDPTQVLASSNALIQTLKDGKAKVDPTEELSLTDALGLQTPAQDLQTKGAALLADLKAKKDAIAANGLCESTFTQASGINAASKDLINSVVSKVPAAAQGIAQGIVAPLLQTLNDAQDAFSPANCKDTGSPPTSSAPPPVTSTPAPPTSTEAPPPTSTVPPPVTTTAPPPGTDTCPAAQTVTVTATDTADCTPIVTCTKKPPVTVTTTKKSCPTGSKLPW
ncbi:cell wall galactomannoprotein Mp2/allergen F17-like protein [Pochonia chlamydosporia 170]|uniref:Cell wall galactomannoprotein Mp2/allergen F17-like protein n=1 Tax=Pochonia chlamydosporia 170 TaxID=1380566 RepID=A0A179FZW5_METCM|nr:cell wall galactomannoprotein Mp2/allergen F17-like protein [Pochonia chlamydosporia 170]OAQ70661.1 cell wall galactomannoprotein Mp2/allergen F17-like protein [Pochonia chlamydosporia 170]